MSVGPRRPQLLAIVALFVLAVAGCHARVAPVVSTPAQAAPPAPRDLAPTVILISLDGWRWDYHTKTTLPNVRRIVAHGVRAEGLIPAFPTKTFPNHYTIVTGLYPGHHGVVGNNMTDPATGAWFSLSDRKAVADPAWWGGQPIWVTAARQGQRAAPMFWPGSEAPIGGAHPADWLPYDEEVPAAARIDRVLEWLDRPAAARPTFITTYFEDVDGAGHTYGPDSPELVRTLRRMDAMLGRLLAGLETRGLADAVNLVLVSDHGMAAASRSRVVALADYVDLDDVEVVDLNPNLAIRPKRGTVDALFARLEHAHPRLHVYRREASPDHWRFRSHPRVPPIVGVVDEGWALLRRRPDPTARFSLGVHGYDPKVRSMWGLFVASGPAFARGKTVPAFENVDVYHVLARVLGLAPAPNDGDVRTADALLAVESR